MGCKLTISVHPLKSSPVRADARKPFVDKGSLHENPTVDVTASNVVNVEQKTREHFLSERYVPPVPISRKKWIPP